MSQTKKHIKYKFTAELQVENQKYCESCCDSILQIKNNCPDYLFKLIIHSFLEGGKINISSLFMKYFSSRAKSESFFFNRFLQ